VTNSDACGLDTELDFKIVNNTGQVLKLSDAVLWPGMYWCQKRGNSSGTFSSIFPGLPPGTLGPGASADVAVGAQLLGGSEARISYNTPNGEQLSVQAAAGDGLVRQNAVKCTPATSTSKWESVCAQHPEPHRSMNVKALQGLGPAHQNANVIGWVIQAKGASSCIPGPFACKGFQGG
jgi:hypothetical protein